MRVFGRRIFSLSLRSGEVLGGGNEESEGEEEEEEIEEERDLGLAGRVQGRRDMSEQRASCGVDTRRRIVGRLVQGWRTFVDVMNPSSSK